MYSSTKIYTREPIKGGHDTNDSTGKYRVDDYIRCLGLPAVFLHTGTFYENMVLRGHVRYDRDQDTIEFRQPIIKADTQCKCWSDPLISLDGNANKTYSGHGIRRPGHPPCR